MNNITPYDYIISPGYIFIPDVPMVLGAVVGNGVVVTMFDALKKRGGMCHFTKPKTKEKRKGTPEYGEIAINTLINFFLKTGSLVQNLKSHVIGGSQMVQYDIKMCKGRNLATENLKTAKSILKKLKINRINYSIGGDQGRKILFHTSTNEMLSATVSDIRKSDWKRDLNDEMKSPS